MCSVICELSSGVWYRLLQSVSAFSCSEAVDRLRCLKRYKNNIQKQKEKQNERTVWFHREVSPMHISSSVSASPMHWNLNSFSESANFLCAVDRSATETRRGVKQDGISGASSACRYNWGVKTTVSYPCTACKCPVNRSQTKTLLLSLEVPL